MHLTVTPSHIGDFGAYYRRENVEILVGKIMQFVHLHGTAREK